MSLKNYQLNDFGIDYIKKGLFIIQLSSKWYNLCKSLTHILEKIKTEGMIDFIQIEIDQNPKICNAFEITAVPNLLFFRNGKFLNKNIHINEYYFIKNGLMIGMSCEPILKEIISKLVSN